MVAQLAILSQSAFFSSGGGRDGRRGARSPRMPAASTVSLLVCGPASPLALAVRLAAGSPVARAWAAGGTPPWGG